LWAVNQADDDGKRKTKANARAERLAAALKTNLRRRKAQARERAGQNRDDAASGDAKPPQLKDRNEQ
jgi:hypothetical protein